MFSVPEPYWFAAGCFQSPSFCPLFLDGVVVSLSFYSFARCFLTSKCFWRLEKIDRSCCSLLLDKEIEPLALLLPAGEMDRLVLRNCGLPGVTCGSTLSFHYCSYRARSLLPWFMKGLQNDQSSWPLRSTTPFQLCMDEQLPRTYTLSLPYS